MSVLLTPGRQSSGRAANGGGEDRLVQERAWVTRRTKRSHRCMRPVRQFIGVCRPSAKLIRDLEAAWPIAIASVNLRARPKPRVQSMPRRFMKRSKTYAQSMIGPDEYSKSIPFRGRKACCTWNASTASQKNRDRPERLIGVRWDQHACHDAPAKNHRDRPQAADASSGLISGQNLRRTARNRRR